MADRTKSELDAEIQHLREQQEATAEVLRVMIRSRSDAQPVFDAIVRNAARLCKSVLSAVYRSDGERVHLVAHDQFSPASLAAVRDVYPVPMLSGNLIAVAVRERQIVHEPDVLLSGGYSELQRTSGYRSILIVPILHDDVAIGAIAVMQLEPRPFPDTQIALLKTFADQAAIAVENVRVFRELEAASRHKTEFLANMSHELRTPLNAIIGYSEMLQEEAEDLGQGAFVGDLEKIRAAGRHLLELINAVLDLSKIEAGKMELSVEEFDVAALVRDIAGVVQPLAEKNSNRLEVYADAGVTTMRADPTKVRQALFNLLANACKFTERGTVTLSAARDGATIVFTVRDTGIGMTPAQMGRLFQDFTQGDASMARRYGGTGLGLSLSQRLCRMMGGDIAVESVAGRGTAFTIRLPMVVAP